MVMLGSRIVAGKGKEREGGHRSGRIWVLEVFELLSFGWMDRGIGGMEVKREKKMGEK